MQGDINNMTLDSELSEQLLDYLSNLEDPDSISLAIDLILSMYPERDNEDSKFYILCEDGFGQVVSDREIVLLTVLINANWLVI